MQVSDLVVVLKTSLEMGCRSNRVVGLGSFAVSIPLAGKATRGMLNLGSVKTYYREHYGD